MEEYSLNANAGIMIHLRPYSMMAKYGLRLKKEMGVEIGLENLDWKEGSGHNRTAKGYSMSELVLMHILEGNRIKFKAKGEQPLDRLKLLTEVYARVICRLD